MMIVTNIVHHFQSHSQHGRSSTTTPNGSKGRHASYFGLYAWLAATQASRQLILDFLHRELSLIFCERKVLMANN